MHRAVMHRAITLRPQLLRRTTMAMGDHTEKLEPDPSNQIGPAYASKVHRDHGAAGVTSITILHTFYIKILDLVGFLIQTVTTFDTDRPLNGDRLDQTFNANYIKTTMGLCILHLLCNRGPKHGDYSRRADS